MRWQKQTKEVNEFRKLNEGGIHKIAILWKFNCYCRFRGIRFPYTNECFPPSQFTHNIIHFEAKSLLLVETLSIRVKRYVFELNIVLYKSVSCKILFRSKLWRTTPTKVIIFKDVLRNYIISCLAYPRLSTRLKFMYVKITNCKSMYVCTTSVPWCILCTSRWWFYHIEKIIFLSLSSRTSMLESNCLMFNLNIGVVLPQRWWNNIIDLLIAPLPLLVYHRDLHLSSRRSERNFGLRGVSWWPWVRKLSNGSRTRWNVANPGVGGEGTARYSKV